MATGPYSYKFHVEKGEDWYLDMNSSPRPSSATKFTGNYVDLGKKVMTKLKLFVNSSG